MFLKNFLFPKFCLGCGFLGCYICLDCQRKLKYIRDDFCLYCGKKSYLGLTHPRCQRKLGIDGYLAIFYYNPLLKKIIKNIKYQLAKEVFNDLFNLIDSTIFIKLKFYKKIEPNIIFQPIPLFKLREKERGFNQAKIITEFISNNLLLPSDSYIERRRNTPLQAKLKKRKDRYINVKGAFDFIKGKDAEGKSFILVDDIVTSGATLKEAGEVLKKNKANKVFGVSLAKG